MGDNCSNIKYEIIRSLKSLAYGIIAVIFVLITITAVWFFLFKNIPPFDALYTIGYICICIVFVGVLTRLSLKI